MINLLPRKEFTLTVGEKEYRGKFGTYAFKLFCNKRGIKLNEVSKIFTADSDLIDIIDEMIDLIICAIQYESERLRLNIKPERVDFYVWIDDGLTTGDELVSLFNHSSDEQVKNVSQGVPPAGKTSNDNSIQLEESQQSSGS